MTTLTHLSDAELDAVTGGSFIFAVVKVAANYSVTEQAQENVNISAFSLVSQGGAQISVTKQVAVA
jgi:hypothetical protein